MGKDYNIDDILDEVKRRQESGIQQEPAVSEEKAVEESVAEEIAAEETKDEPVEEPIVTEEEIKTEPEPLYVNLNEANAVDEIPLEEEGTEEPAEAEEGGMIDLNALTSEEEEAAPASEKKGKKNAKKIIAIVLAVLIALGVGGYFGGSYLINSRLNDVVDKDEEIQDWAGMDKLVECFDAIEETDASELASFKDHVKTWYKNGTPASSTHVLNILLIGEDTRGSEIKDDGTRADSAIICSINKDTKQITLTSILRDTYAYWEDSFGDESTGQFNKINAAMSLGNVKIYCKTVEQLYKVKIDNYVIVNFTGFEKIIDTLGGVTLELTSREIREINSHPKRYGKVTIEQKFEGTKGKQKLTGKQALAYCRIRKLDSDNQRANRQKICLTQVFKQTKQTSLPNVIKIIDQLLGYVKTNMSVKSIKKIAKYALANGWMGYDIVQTTVPEARINEKGSGGTHWGTWCWKTDFPQDAYNLQMKIYGKSNITLARTRVDVLKCVEEGYFSQGAPAVRATIANNHYGEVTTLPTTEKASDKEKTSN